VQALDFQFKEQAAESKKKYYNKGDDLYVSGKVLMIFAR